MERCGTLLGFRNAAHSKCDAELRTFSSGAWERVGLWRSLAVLIYVLAIFVPNDAGAADRYAARTADGRELGQAELQDWNEPGATPRIAGHAIFDAAQPVRWIIDREQPPGPFPEAWVELINGDRLAGETLEYRTGGNSAYDPQPAHLLVRTVGEFQPPDRAQTVDARVGADWVARIVWQRTQSAYQPGTAFLRNGGKISFRTIRWAAGECTVLTADGLKTLSWGDLAELHLPRKDNWDAWLDQLAILNPAETGRIIQQQLADGGLLTTSTERFFAQHWGDKNRPESWLQLVQPVWSLDPLWVRFRAVRAWRFFSPFQVPLTAIVPQQVTRQAVFGSGWREQIDRTVQGQPLIVANQQAGWGIGLHGGAELLFDLPDSVRGVQTRFGLTSEAGAGGCVSFHVVVGEKQELVRREFVTGSTECFDTGLLTLVQGAEPPGRLTLRTDMAHEGRPSAADPFDIRDSSAWLDPEVTLDPVHVRRECLRRALHGLPGLAGWSPPAGTQPLLRVETVYDQFDGQDRRFRTVLRPEGRFLLVSRKLKVAAGDRWLALAVSRYPDRTSPSSIQVRINGRTWCDLDVPQRRGAADPDPILVPVDQAAGTTALVEVVLLPQDERSFVDWRGFALTAEPPGLHRIFEDEPEFAAELSAGGGKAELSAEQPFRGMTSLRLPGGSAEAPQLPDLNLEIAEHPRLGEYRYLVFAWKPQGGSRIELQLARDGALESMLDAGGRRPPLRGRPAGGRGNGEDRGLRHGYAWDAGAEKQSAGAPLRLEWKLPGDWTRHERDVFADFGGFRMTGLALRSFDGEAVWLDHVYLARTSEDVSRLRAASTPGRKPEGDPAVLDRAGQRAEYGPLLSQIAPAFGTAAVRDGLVLRREVAGQLEALQTHPLEADKPFTMRTVLSIPADRTTTLDMHVTHFEKADWQLVVRADGETIHEQRIDESLTIPQRGWATVQVDLSRFAGQTILLEVQAVSNDWQHEYAFWKRVHVVSQ